MNMKSGAEKPTRKRNRIKDYDYSRNGAYFITICTLDRKKVLSKIVGDGFPVLHPSGEIAEKMIHKTTEKYPCVFADHYVIMPDHIHMLLRIDSLQKRLYLGDGDGTGNPSPTIGKIVGWYKYQTSKEINLMNGTTGEAVFQRSYYDHVIRNQQDYDDTWSYIENNPRKWILEKRLIML
ncbi:MAG: hypothetical protein IJN21_08035 [Clostridia bacterium]|nr:hypothetical protein [Clostridia bacterium]